jgi:hypothetical protein
MIQLSATRLRQLWLAVFVLGSLLINFPFISIFDRELLVLGFPLLYVYFLLGWFASICVIFVYCSLIKGRGMAEDGD